MAVLSRSDLYDVLVADARLAAWHVYGESPEQLAGAAAIVIVPRPPYQAWQTYGELEWHVTIWVLVPRTHGPAMDMIDTGLAALRSVLVELEGVGVGQVGAVGILEDYGSTKYIGASLDVDMT